jgi:N-acyl-D-amino-acid deacylase
MSHGYDLVIKNARVFDGSGGPWYEADIAVRNGRIAGIGKVDASDAAQCVDAEGRAVSPGFIDPHCHSDCNCTTVNDTDGKILQGVTTEIGGNCGLSISPVSSDRMDLLRDYLKPFIPKEAMPDFSWTRAGEIMDIVDRNGHSTDLAFLAGQGSIRIAVMGFDDRKPTEEELGRMKELLGRELEDGCVGLSTGLIYPPGCFSDEAELTELCRVTARYGGVYATHMRGESGEILKSVEEAIRTAEKSGCRLQISHHKIINAYEGLSGTTLGMMEEARNRGVDVACDVYPYSAGATLISVVLPQWAKEGGVGKMLERLGRPEDRERIKFEFTQEIPGWDNFVKGASYDRILICTCKNDAGLEGKTVRQVAEARGVDPADAILDIIVSEEAEVTIVIDSQSASDNRRIIAHELSMIGSDSLPSSMTGRMAIGRPHPRCFGTFPRVLGHFVREEGVLSLERAVWKMSGFPAQRFNLADRGLIKQGLIADFVVFDPATVGGSADYITPRRVPTGIDYVVKNGVVVVEGGRFLSKTLGKSVRRLGSSPRKAS